MQYKIGDHVVIKESNIEYIEKFAGRTGVIKRINSNFSDYPYWIDVDNWGDENCGVWCKVKCLVALDNTDKIVITHDGKTTKATLYHGDTKTVATAKCSPEDTFDFNVGAKLAMERLMEAVEPPKYYNGKIVCIDDSLNKGLYTLGKIYEFVDGTFICDNGTEVHKFLTCERVKSFNDWKKFSSSKWLEIKE
jgi:hypothetical protein